MNPHISSTDPLLLSNGVLISNWREQVMISALTADSHSGDGDDAILAGLRLHAPDLHTMVVYAVRNTFLDPMREMRDFRSMLTTEHTFMDDSDEEPRPYFGWWSAAIEGVQIEVITVAEWSDPADIVVASTNREILEKFTVESLKTSMHPKGRCMVYSSTWRDAPELEESVSNARWEDIILPNEQMAAIRSCVEEFPQQKEAFHALGFPWRRGILLVGPPGTGKTMICRAVGASLPDYPLLYVRDLHERRDRDSIVTIFARARLLAPCVLVFEDVDGLVSEHNRTQFLNEIDGFRSNEGVFMIASTNHPEKIDTALLRRPSRFDRVFQIGLPGPAEREEFVRRTLSRPEFRDRLSPEIDIDALSEHAARESGKFTPAFLKEAVLSAVLEYVQQGKTILDAQFEDVLVRNIGELAAYLKASKNSAALGEFSTGYAGISLRDA